MKLTNDTTVLLNSKLLDLQDIINTRVMVSRTGVKSADLVADEIGELLRGRLGTETIGQTELESAASKVAKQMGVFIQLNKTVANLQDLAGEEVDMTSLDNFAEILKGKLKSAFDLTDKDFQFEETE